MSIVTRLRQHSAYHHIVGPLWRRIPSKARWSIASWLDESPLTRARFNWCDLVDAALDDWPDDDWCDRKILPLPARTPDCSTRPCEWYHDHGGDHACRCYCGKFALKAPEVTP